MKAHPGFCTFVDGLGVRFLYLQETCKGREIWWVKRIFAPTAEDEIEFNLTIREGQTFRPIHTQI